MDVMDIIFLEEILKEEKEANEQKEKPKPKYEEDGD